MRRSMLISIFATAFLALVPLAGGRSASFLGTDMSAVAAGVVEFYPEAAVSEIVKVMATALSTVFITVSIFRIIAARCFSSPLGRFLTFPVAPAIAYLLWLGGTALAYPALFEDHLPDAAKYLLFRASFVLTPRYLHLASLVFLLAPFAAVVCRRALVQVRFAGPLMGAAAFVGFTSLLVYGCDFLGQILTRPEALAAEQQQDQSQPPHVLLIGIDSLRSDRLENLSITPALQQLKQDRQTAVFSDHWVGIPRTFPSWLEILQGRFAPRTGIRHMFPGFKARENEFPGIVTAARGSGYRTIVVSDFAGDIFPRFRAGFEVVDAPKLTLQTMIKMSVDQLFPAFLPLVVSEWGLKLFPALKESPAFADAKHVTDKIIKYVAKSGDRPLFLTAFYSTAHFPYAAPHPYFSMFAKPNYEGKFRFQKNPDLASSQVAMSEVEIAQVRALYDGAVRSVDDQLQRLFLYLRSRGLWDDMLVVVTADHGEDLFEAGRSQGHGEHLRGEHVLHVPLLIKLPKHIQPARRNVDFPTRAIDIAPTLAGILGFENPGFAGTNLHPWLQDADANAPALSVYAETGIWFARGGEAFFQRQRLDYPGISSLLSFDQGYSGEITLNPFYEDTVVTAKHRMLIEGDYKLIYLPTAKGVKYELFHRRLDPNNQLDISTNEPQILAEMRQKLLALMASEDLDYRVVTNDDFMVPR